MTAMRVSCRWLAVLVLVLSLPAFAEDNDRAQAKEHYLKGTRAYELGAYEEAISEYGAAYRFKDDPALLFNLGQANRLGGHTAEALRLYRIYLKKRPDASNRAEVEAKIAELQKQLLDQQSKPRSAPPEQVKPATPPEVEPKPAEPAAPAVTISTEPARVDLRAGRTKKIVGLTVGAVGVAALATGIAFGVLAKNAGDDLSRLDQQMGIFDGAKQQEGQTDQIVEGVMLGVGAAAVAAGAVVYVIGHRESRAARVRSATLIPLAGPRQAGAALQVRF
jgi:tetratricopeptide (TPR) repeat protein